MPRQSGEGNVPEVATEVAEERLAICQGRDFAQAEEIGVGRDESQIQHLGSRSQESVSRIALGQRQPP